MHPIITYSYVFSVAKAVRAMWKYLVTLSVASIQLAWASGLFSLADTLVGVVVQYTAAPTEVSANNSDYAAPTTIQFITYMNI